MRASIFVRKQQAKNGLVTSSGDIQRNMSWKRWAKLQATEKLYAESNSGPRCRLKAFDFIARLEIWTFTTYTTVICEHVSFSPGEGYTMQITFITFHIVDFHAFFPSIRKWLSEFLSLDVYCMMFTLNGLCIRIFRWFLNVHITHYVNTHCSEC